MFLSNFREQVVWLILTPDRDTAVGKYAENNEHKNFYVENLVPNQGKKPRPATHRIFLTSLSRANRLQSSSDTTFRV